jgi:hypothetical protein
VPTHLSEGIVQALCDSPHTPGPIQEELQIRRTRKACEHRRNRGRPGGQPALGRHDMHRLEESRAQTGWQETLRLLQGSSLYPAAHVQGLHAAGERGADPAFPVVQENVLRGHVSRSAKVNDHLAMKLVGFR